VAAKGGPYAVQCTTSSFLHFFCFRVRTPYEKDKRRDGPTDERAVCVMRLTGWPPNNQISYRRENARCWIHYRSIVTHYNNSLVVCQAARSASVTELRQQLHWMPVRQRITYNLAVITYKTRSAGTPAYLSHLIRDCIPARTLKSCDKLLHSISDAVSVIGESLHRQRSFSLDLTVM